MTTTYDVQYNYVAYILANRRDEDVDSSKVECILDTMLEEGIALSEENILFQYDEEYPRYKYLPSN